MGIISTEDLTKPLFAISDDLERAEKELLANSDSYSRRNYIRVLFAAIEMTIHVFKLTVLVASSSSPGKLTRAELALLHEEAFDIDDKGTVRTKPKFLRVSDNLQFATRSVEKGFGLSLKLDRKNRDWQDFTEAVKIRNRVTHPKGHKDFDVSDHEIELVLRVGHWFTEFIGDWFSQFIATTKPSNDANTTKVT